MKEYRFSGYRILEFSGVVKSTLREVARRLLPYENEILDGWVTKQMEAWSPPALSDRQLRKIFGALLHHMLVLMDACDLEKCISDMAEAGEQLAKHDFPYEALIVSFHFLEESYMPYLLNPQPPNIIDWLTQMDEFLHAALAAVATSYFEIHRRRLLEQVEVGRIVQESLMPHIPQRMSDLEIAYFYLSAGERVQVGGDLVEILEADDGRVGFIIGDLSGHGLEAAADAIKLRSLFRGFMRDEWDTVKTVNKLNAIMRAELKPGYFATVLAGSYDGHGKLTIVSAGHPPPVLCNEKCSQLQPAGIPLGVESRFSYLETDVGLEPGGLFVAYTDGLVEARRDGRMFGELKVLAAVESMKTLPPRAVVDQLKDEVLRYVEGNIQDDAAILVLKRAASS